MSRYQFIGQAASTETVQVLCRVLEVSAAGYYRGGGQTDRHLVESLRPPPPFRAMPSAMAPSACGPKGTPSGATRYALGCAAAACGR